MLLQLCNLGQWEQITKCISEMQNLMILNLNKHDMFVLCGNDNEYLFVCRLLFELPQKCPSFEVGGHDFIDGLGYTEQCVV